MAVSYTNLNLTSDPVTMQALDTGVATAPTDRPSTFTPAAGYVAPATVGQTNFGAATNDWSVATVPTLRPRCWEPSSVIVTIDPGLELYG